MAKPKKDIAAKASEIIAKLDEVQPIAPAEYLEAAPDPEPSAADAAAMAALLVEDPYDPPTSPCPHCAGTGMVAVDRSPAIPEAGPHLLDSAPVNSKIVVVLIDSKSHAVLGTPDGAKELPAGDPAHRLPEGARIRKLGEREFLAEQLNASEDHAPITRESAGRAIADFIPHFHPSGLSR